MATEGNKSVRSDQPSSSSQPEGESLSDRFAYACATTPLPKHQRANLPDATEEELRYLVQNDSGEIFLSPDAIWQNDDKSRPTIMSAMTKALRHACEGYDIDIFPSEETDGQPAEKEHEKTVDNKEAQKDDVNVENGDENEGKKEEARQMQTACSILGIPDFKPMPELRTLTWANSEAKKVIDAFNEETDRIRAERAAKEAAEEAAFMAKVPQAARKPTPPSKPSVAEDPILWAAQEEAAACAVMRDLRARSKKSLWGSKSTKLKPEAAAEMARARVAAAAAAAVMRNEDRGAELVRAEAIDSSDFLERFAKGKQEEGGFYPMHAQVFQRAMSLDSDPEGKKKKKVAFAADTVFTRKK